jgi:acetyltransferase
MSTFHLDHLFAPRTLALVGRFAGETSRQRTVLQNLCASACEEVSVVDLGGGPAPEGLPTCGRWLSDLAELRPEVDVLVADLPLGELPPVLDRCGELGVRAAILPHRRMTPEDAASEREVRARARSAGVRLLGPNSFGVMVPGTGLNASLFEGLPAAGQAALISQSGSLISSILDRARHAGLGFSHVVSLGALGDIDFGDTIDYLAWEPGVSCLLLYVENLASVKKFLSACRAATRAKPIVAIKGGRSPLGREIIAKHTGRPAGEDRVYDTAFRRAGVIRVETIGELLASGASLSRRAPPRGDRLGIVTNSGGIGVLAADSLAARGARVGALSPALRSQLEQHVAPYSGSLNPVCLASDADADRFGEVIRLYLDSREVDTILVILVPNPRLSPAEVVERAARHPGAKGVDLLYAWLASRREHEVQARRLAEQGHAVYTSLEEATGAYCYALKYFENLSHVVVVPPRFDHGLTYRQDEGRQWVAAQLRGGPGPVDRDAGPLLEAYGVPVNPVRAVSSAGEAAAVARDLGYPVALRPAPAPAPGGPGPGPGVVTAWSEGELGAAYDRLRREASGVALQRVVRDARYELRLGVRTDVEFGPYLFLGAGGSMGGVVGDEAVILPPLNRLLAGKLIARSRLDERLALTPGEREGLEEILVRVSQLVVDVPEVRELTLDPVVLTGRGFLGQDSRVILEDRGVASPRHLVTAPYPNQYEFSERLKDGTPVLIRPIRPEDAPTHYAFLRSLSPETLYNRFFGFRKEVTDAQMVRFTQIDYDREIAIVARVEQDGEEATIGVNRLVYDPHRGAYEFAVVVADAWQGSGVGGLLMEKIVLIARDRGIRTIHGLVLAVNRKMLALAHRIGFVVAGRDADAVVIRLDL